MKGLKRKLVFVVLIASLILCSIAINCVKVEVTTQTVTITEQITQTVTATSEEEKQTELHNMKIAVLALMVANDATQLTEAYNDVDTAAEMVAVTCRDGGDDVGDNSLKDWFIGGARELLQAYDINVGGEVTVS